VKCFRQSSICVARSSYWRNVLDLYNEFNDKANPSHQSPANYAGQHGMPTSPPYSVASRRLGSVRCCDGSLGRNLGRLLIDPPSYHPPITNYPSLLHYPSCPLTPPHPPRILTSCPHSMPLWNLTNVKPKKDLTSHPLLPTLQSCDSPEAILTALREQVPAFNQTQNGDDRLTKWVSPTVNVIYTFSATIGQGVGLVCIGIFYRGEFSL
jgi:hypothetical protein